MAREAVPRYGRVGAAGADLPPLTERERVLHFLRRFTLGPTPGLVEEVSATGIREWLDDQLADRAGPSAELDGRLSALDSIHLTNREVFNRYVKPVPRDASTRERKAFNRQRKVPGDELRDSVLYHAVYGPNQVREVAADFFRNHFSVALDKGWVRFLATEYEREVIRPGSFGSFRQILGASAKHPAMLVYLDNVLSRRPPTKAELKKIEMRERLKSKSKERGLEASDIAGQRGLNENYAREVLELHTLGVDNFYKQMDVEAVARALTGWTITKNRAEPLGFEFRPEMHSGGNKKVLHKVIRRNWKNPQDEGEQVLDLLARHKGTADFMARKLCRFFVRDDPPEGIVKRVASAFRRSKGDLPTTYRAIVDDAEFFAPENYGAKFKRPFEYVVSALRATGADVQGCQGLHDALGAMNESLYMCKDPTGYYDQAEAWLDPGALAVRWKFAKDLVAGKVRGVEVPRSLYAGLEDLAPEAFKQELLQRVLPTGVRPRTSRVLDAMIAEHVRERGRAGELAPTLLIVILGSPDFQEQ